MQILKIGLLAAIISLAGTANAVAAPLTIALFGAAFAATTAGAIVSVVFSTVISIGVSLLAQSLLKKDQQQQADPGIEFEVQMGDTVPIGFPIGETATAGSREYIGAWGVSGGTPNAYLVDVLTISDIPLPGQPGLWLGDTKCTILWNETPVDQGYPIEEFRVGGKDYAWVKYQDGTQTEVDAYLFAKFGTHPEHPWTDDMIGEGVAFVIVTTLMNRDLFSGEPKKLIEPPVASLYDVRKDSTAGGDGDHRWGDWSTYEPSTNAKVLEYNILRGIYYGDNDEWMFGGQDLPAFRLPASNWIAAMNACDAEVELSEGGTEPAYRAGMYVTGDLEPLQVAEELRKASNSRTAEDGGVFRTLVGLPASAVYAFTDDDILITEGQSFEPFPNLDNTNNVVEATYPEPREQWRDKDAPARRDEAAIEADGGRELPASVRYTACPYPNQVQRLQLAQSQDDRRFRVHSFSLPPDSWLLSAGVDEVSWTSARNGYSNKKFLVLKIAGKRNSCQSVMLKEVDAGDFDWDTEFELPEAVGPIGPLPVPAQPMTGWQVFADYLQDSGGSKQRASIRVEFDANQVDVARVRVQARVKASGSLQFDAEIPYEDVSGDPKAVILNGVFLPSTVYEVRGKFIPYSTRQTEWSDWLEVTTPSVSEASLPDLYYQIVQRVEELGGDLRILNRLFEQQAGAAAIDQVLLEEEKGQRNIGLGSVYDLNKAAAELALQVATTSQSALAQFLVGLIATTQSGTAEVLARFTALSDTGGLLARAALQVRAEYGADWAAAALELGVVSTPSGLQSLAILSGDQVYLRVDGVDIPAFGLQRGDEAKETPLVYSSSEAVYTITVDLRQKHKTFTSVLDHDADIRFPVGAWVGAEFTLIVEQESPGGYELTYDESVFIVGDELQQPSASPGVFSVYKGTIISLSPPIAALKLEISGATTSGAETVFSIDPPIDGKSVWNLALDGPLEIDGPVVGAADKGYTIIPLGIRLDCIVELWGCGGTSGSIMAGGTLAHPDNPADATFHDLVAGSGKSSLSRLLANGIVSTAGGDGGVATGGDTNEDGDDGTTGSKSGAYVLSGAGGASPDGGATQPGELGIGISGNEGGGEGDDGNDVGGGASGAWRWNAAAGSYVSTGGGGGAAKTTKQYDEFDTLLQDTEYEILLPAPKPAIISTLSPVTGVPPTGAHGGRSKIIISALP